MTLDFFRECSLSYERCVSTIKFVINTTYKRHDYRIEIICVSMNAQSTEPYI